MSEDTEERAAIVAYDGNIPRALAEWFAQLDPNQPPSGIRANQWVRFVDDVGRLLDKLFGDVRNR